MSEQTDKKPLATYKPCDRCNETGHDPAGGDCSKCDGTGTEWIAHW